MLSASVRHVLCGCAASPPGGLCRGEGSAAVVEARYGQQTAALRKRLEQGLRLGQVKR